MLWVEGLDAFYGNSHVLRRIDLGVGEGEVVAVLGRNGVGKTTLLKSIMGLLHVRSGRIRLREADITNLPPYRIALHGIGYVPQEREIFPDFTVLENLKIGGLETNGRDLDRTIGEMCELFPLLGTRRNQLGGTLSGGEQQILALARALVGRPRLLLLDEPTEGIQPTTIAYIVEKLSEINRRLRVSILLVEQNLGVAFRLATRCYILEKGEVVATGTPDTLRDDAIIKKHLAF